MVHAHWDLHSAFASVYAPIAEARGLPNFSYRDPDFFKFEAKQVFKKQWICIGAGADIPRRGDRRPVEVAGQPLLMVRGRDDAVRVFYNVCRHRGTKLCTQAESGPVLRCPYHSWAYSLAGELLTTPMVGGAGSDEEPSIPRKDFGLLSVPTARWHDLVFVNLSGDAKPLQEELAPLAENWQDYDLSQLTLLTKRQFRLASNWKLAIENFLEAYHLPWVHPSLNSYSPLSDHVAFNVADRFVGNATRAFRMDTAKAEQLPRFPGLAEEKFGWGDYPMVFPNLMLGVQKDHHFVLIAEPISAEETLESLYIYVVDDGTEDEQELARRGKIHQKLIADWEIVFKEDIDIVERLQQGRAADGFDGGKFAPFHDHATHRFMQIYADCFKTASEDKGKTAAVS